MSYGFIGTKKDFLEAVSKTEEFISGLEKNIGFADNSEKRAWHNSVCIAMRKILESKTISDDIGVAVEYRIPSLDNRIDMMLSGKDKSGKTVILIIELKQWSKINGLSKDGNNVLVEWGQKRVVSYTSPAKQAHDYKIWLQLGIYDKKRENLKFHSAAYLHNYEEKRGSSDMIRKAAIDGTDIFTKFQNQDFIDKITELIPYGDGSDGIRYIEENFTGCSETLRDEIKSLIGRFELSAEQKHISKIIEESVAASVSTGKKKVLIINGGPGTGKSVTALNALSAVRCQYGSRESYYLTKNEALRKVYGKKLIADREKRDALTHYIFKDTGSIVKSKNILLSIVDESQRLTDSTKRNRYKTTISVNPQTNDIIEASDVTVFFIDEKQIVSLIDAGNIAEIIRYCKEKGYDCVAGLELSTQFRCNGSDKYLKWLDDMLYTDNAEPETIAQTDYDIKVMDSFDQFYNEMEQLNSYGNHSRMVAGGCWTWKSKDNPDDPRNADFPETMKCLTWNRNTWIYKDYVWATDENSFPHIGIIHTCQGLEFDYIGVIIGPDLKYEDGKIKTDYTKRSDDDYTLYKNRIRRENKYETADQVIRNTYRILLTRGLKGCRIYCANEDGTLNKALADHIKSKIQQPCFAYYDSYYHRDRNCRWIAKKADDEIMILDNEQSALERGMKPCINCCR